MKAFSGAQVAAAGKLVVTGGLKATDVRGTFLARSSAGKFEYICDRNGCTCPATGPCKHQAAVLMTIGDWKAA